VESGRYEFSGKSPQWKADTGEKAHCSSSQVAHQNKSSTLLRARKISPLESEIQQSRQIGVM